MAHLALTQHLRLPSDTKLTSDNYHGRNATAKIIGSIPDGNAGRAGKRNLSVRFTDYIIPGLSKSWADVSNNGCSTGALYGTDVPGTVLSCRMPSADNGNGLSYSDSSLPEAHMKALAEFLNGSSNQTVFLVDLYNGQPDPRCQFYIFPNHTVKVRDNADCPKAKVSIG